VIVTAHSASLPLQVRQEEGNWFWRDVLAPFLVTRFLLVAIGFVTVNTMAFAPESTIARIVIPHAWLAAWGRWDALWYMQIVRDGYFFTPGKQSSVAFFPLYPMMMKAGGYLLGQNEAGWIQSGILISNGMLLFAMACLWKLVRLDYDEQTARRAVLYALIAPTTLFFSAAYPMSLILAIALASFYLARKGDWWSAGAIAALAPLARPDGILLVPGLAFEYLRQRDFHFRQVRPDVAAVALPPCLTLAAWLIFLHLRFGDALAFVHVQNAWPPSTLAMARFDFEPLFGVVAAMLTVALLAIGWLKLRSSYMVYATLHFALMLSASRFSSMPRFVLVLFPAYIALALLGRSTQFDRMWTLASAGLATVVFVRFSLCYFVG
jgi:Mannosyltransferase (PIG-V)